jgi:hypothetical protein
MPRPPVKKTRKLAEAQAYGETLGALKAHAHWNESKKSLPESLRGHLGTLLDNATPKTAVDAAINAGLAYLGFEVFGDWKGALVGPIALKLATADSEIGAAAGVAALGILGLLPVAGGVINAWKEWVEQLTGRTVEWADTSGNCPPGYTKYVGHQGVYCLKDAVPPPIETPPPYSAPPSSGIPPAGSTVDPPAVLACIARHTAAGWDVGLAKQVCRADASRNP